MTGQGPIQLSDPLIGATVGEYTIVDTVGEGGMGVVYRGLQPVIKKRVAVKVLKAAIASDEQQVNRLIAEAEAVNAIRHRGIIDIFGLGKLPDGRPYVVMEFLEGEPLDARLRRERPGFTEGLSLLLEMCSPLGAAHTAGVVHRDLKPSNVFLCKQSDGTRYVKLLDFGLAKRVQGVTGSTAQTSTATVTGTPDYMAPEQARGAEVSPRTDIYSLGIMLFELIRGRVPFSGAAPMDVMVSHVSKPPPPLRSGNVELDELVARMLAKDPAARPQTVGEVKACLERVLLAPVKGPIRTGEHHPAPGAGSRTPLVVGAGLALLGLMAAGVGVWAGRRGPETKPVPVAPDPGPTPLAVTPPDAGLTVERPADSVVVAGPAKVKSEAPDAGRVAKLPVARSVVVPSRDELDARLSRHEAQTADPSAVLLLQKLRRQLKADDSVAGRRKVFSDLESWERLNRP